MVQVMTQNMESRKIMMQVMPVAGWGVGPQLPLSVTSAAHAGPKILILSESFGVIIFLNNFKKITPEGL